MFQILSDSRWLLSIKQLNDHLTTAQMKQPNHVRIFAVLILVQLSSYRLPNERLYVQIGNIAFELFKASFLHIYSFVSTFLSFSRARNIALF